MIHFRKANKSDEYKIKHLIKDILDAYEIYVNRSEIDEDLSDIEKYYFNNNGWFEILEDENQLLGSYGIYKIDNTTCELRKMYLSENLRGKGFGKQMMNKAIQKASELGYSTMILETNKQLDKAVGLYRKCGFEPYTPSHFIDCCDFAMKREIKV